VTAKEGHSPEQSAGAESASAGIGEAAILLGWIVPTREEDVLCAERDLAAGPVTLPERLRDVKSVFEGMGQVLPKVEISRFVPDNPQVDAALARAAREAGRLTSEIEERMRCDRKAAEEEREKDGHGKDVR